MTTEGSASTWLESRRRAVLDHLPRCQKDGVWLWVLAAQAEADPTLVRRMALVEALMDGRLVCGLFLVYTGLRFIWVVVGMVMS